MLHYYLHVQAIPLMANFTRAIATHGAFTLLPGHNVASEVLPVLFQQDQHLKKNTRFSFPPCSQWVYKWPTNEWNGASKSLADHSRLSF
jgi:hypothetical protein